MKKWTEHIFAAWADCDAAGKVFYPNFYIWFDRSTEKLFKANNLTFAELEKDFGIVGMPLLETNAKYENVCLHGHELTLDSWVDSWDGKPFVVRHKVTRGDSLSKIATKYSVSPRSIVRANRISNPNRIRVGQVLRIPR